MNSECSNESRKNMVGANIRAIRSRLSMSQKQLAELIAESGLPMTSCTLCKIESGTRGISDIELWHIASVFHITVDKLYK